MATYTELLAQVDQAIQDVLTQGQSYAIKDRRFNRADLAQLKDMRKEYASLAARETRGGIRVRGVTPA